MHVIAPDELFRALADTTRLRCLVLLKTHGELCVCELTHALGAAQPKISRHLAQLRELGLATDRREGLWVHYRISPELPEWVTEIIRITTDAVSGKPPFADDRKALAGMPDRPTAPCCT